jgi:RNA polymerase sigma factor (sigma-70 family)
VTGFEETFNVYYPRVYRLLAGLTGDPAAAQDIAQEVFLALYQKPPRETEALGGWLAQVARNMALNHKRAQRRQAMREMRAGMDIPDIPGPEAVAEREEDIREVRQALQRLPERDRDILLLKQAGFSYAEIAAAVRVKPSSVGTLLARARASFEASFEEVSGGGELSRQGAMASVH